MKEYLNALKKALENQALSKDVIEEVLKDHEEMLQAAFEDGLSEAELTKKFGDPEKIAKELSQVEGSQTAEKDLERFKTFTVKAPFKIETETSNADITYNLIDSNDLQIWTDDAEMKGYRIVFEDDCLCIRSKEKSSMGLFNFLSTGKKHKLMVKIPKQLCRRIYHKSVNGPVLIEGLHLESADINTVNGRLTALDTTMNHATFHTVNGEIKGRKLTLKQLHTSQISGLTDLKALTVEDDITINTVSGDSHLEDIKVHRLHLKSVSGRIKGTEIYPKVCQLKSVSGSILIENKTKTDIDIEKEKTVSGTIKITQP